ncbi:hypothetical protein BDZ94DRAFT_1194273 [Collybia nuda]|uniref:Uncharacterized protein n=1 Tax=Collybia nuda TaxID=64659 RepID=A0A9P5Y5K9_9AGAR|nr:hypothetical protein BDZ94DRAFT_1194273 [Collybia nuda]
MLSVPKLFFTITLNYILSAIAVPTWEGLNGRNSIGSLVPGAAYIEAIGPTREHDYQTRHLSVQIPGQPGNLTLAPNTRAPPLFYIHRNQLWQYNNETAIYYVNVVNTTETSHFPLQLVLGRKKVGITNGFWQWRGTMLYYDQGQKGITGIYYNCPLEDGSAGVFMYLQPGPTPLSCEQVTLHSFSRSYRHRNGG